MSFDDLINNLNNDELFIKDDVILLAISGGPDSIFMAEYLRKNVSDKELVLYHLNHMIREEAERDEKFVRQYAERYGLKLYVSKVDIPMVAKEQSMGLEEAGRSIRYKHLRELASKLNTNTVITCHHLDDDIETFLMNFSRGTGANGASGIKIREGIFFRPMLSMTKEAILEYLDKNEIHYVVDKTNFIPDTKRNFIRLELVPYLKEYDDNFYKNFKSLLQGMKEQTLLLHSFIDDYIDKEADFSYGIGIKILDIKTRFSQNPGALYMRIIERVLGTKEDVYRKNIETINELLDKHGEKISEFGELRIIKSYNYLYFTRKGDEYRSRQLDLSKDIDKKDVVVAKIPIKAIYGKAVLDKRRIGDKMDMSNGHTRSLKELMIDLKIPRFKRDKLNVVRDNMGILYVEDIGVSNRCIIDSEEYIYIIERSKNE